MRGSVLDWIVKRFGRPSEIDYRLIAESSNDVVILCDENAIASYVSPSSFDLLGVEPETMIGKSYLAYVLPEDLPLLEAVFADHGAGKAKGRLTHRMLRKSGDVVWVEGSGRAVRNSKQGRVDFVVVLRDVSERKALETKLEALAATDGLTGLANRRAFDEALEVEWRRAKRTQTRLSLLMLDVDQFKSFNDRYGHPVGDDCLRSISATIKNTLRRGGDFAARFGGEEMVVILPDTNLDGAVTVAEAIRSAVYELCVLHEGNPQGMGYVTVSIGVATASFDGGGVPPMPAELLQAADMALYEAKNAGRNRISSAPPPPSERRPTKLSA